MAKKQQTLIKLADVKKQQKKLNTYETYIINAEAGSVIKFYPVFDMKKIELLKRELYEKLNYAKKANINFLENDFEFYNYMYFLIVKYFTHLEKEIADDFETQILQMDSLVSTGLFKLILSDVLPQEEIQKVFDEVMDFLDNAEKIIALEEKFKAEAKQKVKNKYVLGTDNAKV